MSSLIKACDSYKPSDEAYFNKINKGSPRNITLKWYGNKSYPIVITTVHKTVSIVVAGTK